MFYFFFFIYFYLFFIFLFILGYGDLSVFPFTNGNTSSENYCSEGGILTPNLESMAKQGPSSALYFHLLGAN